MITVRIRQILLSFVAILFLLLVKPPPLLTQSQTLNKNGSNEIPSSSRLETPATMIEAIHQRNAEIDKKAEALELKEQRLKIMEQGIKKMINKNEQILETINQKNAQKNAKLALEQEERTRRISKIYEKMPPEEAAIRIDKMKESLALDLLRVIKPKSVAQILIGLSPAKAAKLSEKLNKKPR